MYLAIPGELAERRDEAFAPLAAGARSRLRAGKRRRRQTRGDRPCSADGWVLTRRSSGGTTPSTWKSASES